MKLEKLVSQQFRIWEQRKLQEKRHEKSRYVQNRPIICFSRQTGAGVSAVGGHIAEELGFQYIDKQIVNYIANSSKTLETAVAMLDERSRTTIDSAIHDLFLAAQLKESTYMKHLAKAILTIGEYGRAVLVGRCAHRILPPEQILSVRLVAHVDDRVNHIMELNKLGQDDAVKFVEQNDRERRDFVQRNFGIDIEDPCGYDLLLNVSRFSPTHCSQVIIQAFRQRFPDYEVTGPVHIPGT